jgi:hypothetical protein
MEEVEDAIKQTILDSYTGNLPRIEFDIYSEDGKVVTEATEPKSKDEIHIHVADYFDVMSGQQGGRGLNDIWLTSADQHVCRQPDSFWIDLAGTSTGAILAGYFATKGGYTQANIMTDKAYKSKLGSPKVRDNILNGQPASSVVPGRCRCRLLRLACHRGAGFPSSRLAQ